MKDNQDCYKPEEEEVEDAIYFMMNCSNSDLVSAWNRVSSEWDLESVIKIHNFLSQTYRMADLLDELSSEESTPVQ